MPKFFFPALFAAFFAFIPPAAAEQIETADGPYVKVVSAEYDLYLPAEPKPRKKYPIVVSLTPNADAAWGWRMWEELAPRHGWAVFVSKRFSNDTEAWMFPEDKKITVLMKQVFDRYPVDPDCVVIGGFSGGGMEGYEFAMFDSWLPAGVVTNGGEINPPTRRSAMPDGKFAAILAGKKDPRYARMAADAAFLKKQKWQVLFLTYEGGHAVAPAKLWRQAAAWIDARFDEVRKAKAALPAKKTAGATPAAAL